MSRLDDIRKRVAHDKPVWSMSSAEASLAGRYDTWNAMHCTEAGWAYEDREWLLAKLQETIMEQLTDAGQWQDAMEKISALEAENAKLKDLLFRTEQWALDEFGTGKQLDRDEWDKKLKLSAFEYPGSAVDD